MTELEDKADESILINGCDGMTAKICGTSRALSRHILGLIPSLRGRDRDPTMYENAPLVNHRKYKEISIIRWRRRDIWN